MNDADELTKAYEAGKKVGALFGELSIPPCECVFTGDGVMVQCAGCAATIRALDLADLSTVREAAAKVADAHMGDPTPRPNNFQKGWLAAATSIAATIRALPLTNLPTGSTEAGLSQAGLVEALKHIKDCVEDEAYKVVAGQAPCKHTTALNEIHEIADAILGKIQPEGERS